MIRIFSLLSVLTILIILMTGSGTYWVLQSDANLIKKTYSNAITKGFAASISTQTSHLQTIIDQMAGTSEVISALESNNPIRIKQTTKNLETLLPTALKIRILPANVSELDETQVPHMGNADLIMVKETLNTKQPAIIQGLKKNRHLAITAVIKKNEQAIGVILASFKYNFLQKYLTKLQLKEGYIELKQANAIIAKSGNIESKIDTAQTINIPKSSWKIHYWLSVSSLTDSISIIIAIFITSIAVSCLLFFISYRKVIHTLKQDQSTVLKAVKDLMSGKSVGSYPVNLTEMKAIISTIVQFKRVLDKGGQDFSSDDSEREIDNFFDEPDGVSFMDTYQDADTQNGSIQLTESVPVPIPEAPKQENTDAPLLSSEKSTKNLSNINSSIFRAYDIRGIAGETLTKEIVFNIGRAIGSDASEKNIKRIVVGRDGRSSSPTLAESLAKGIIATGVDVLDIGLVPSPVVYFITKHTEGKSGVVITGSHNPANYNGLKIIINDETLAGDKIQQLKQRIDNDNLVSAGTGTIEQNKMYTNEYIGSIAEDIHIIRPMKVVVDCGNGAAGEIAPILLKTLGCEVIELFCEIDGTFPNHHPDPSNPKNLEDLITAVKHYNAEVGIAFDGDGDRLGVVDSSGKIIWPDRQLMLFAKDVLSQRPNSDIIYDVKSSRHLYKQIESRGGHPIMWKTGHSFMKAKIKETNAALAGEMSGHIFFNDRWLGFDDALYAASRLIEILSADKRNSEQVFADFPDSVNTPEINIELAEGENNKFMEKLFAVAYFEDAEIITIDGLRVEFSDGWGLIRASNTTPSLVLRFEADDTEALKRIQSQFKELLTRIKSDLTLPF